MVDVHTSAVVRRSFLLVSHFGPPRQSLPHFSVYVLCCRQEKKIKLTLPNINASMLTHIGA
jgi:hypothetical protein